MTARVELVTAPKKLAAPAPAFPVVINEIDPDEPFAIATQGRSHLVLQGTPGLRAHIRKTREGWSLMGPWHSADGMPEPTLLLSGDVFWFGEWRLRLVDDQPSFAGWWVGGWHMFAPLRTAPEPVWRARHGQTRAFAEAMVFEEDDLESEVHRVSQVKHPAVPCVVDVHDQVLFRDDAAGVSLGEVFEASRAQGARLDVHIVLHVVATVAEACAAGLAVPAIVAPSTIMLAWDGRVLFTGFGRAPVARGSRDDARFRHANAPSDWRQRTGSRGGHALGVVAWELLHGRDFPGRARTRNAAWPPADELVKRAVAQDIDVVAFGQRARDVGDAVSEADVAATVRALFPEAWRVEEALRDEP